MLYIVMSGIGYFVQFVNGSPEMTTDRGAAKRMFREDAEVIIYQLHKLGFDASLMDA
jgi:hypothetical protein